MFLRKVVLKYAANFQRTPMPKCDFNKVANHTLAWLLSCKFAAYFQIFLRTPLGGCFYTTYMRKNVCLHNLLFNICSFITFFDIFFRITSIHLLEQQTQKEEISCYKPLEQIFQREKERERGAIPGDCRGGSRDFEKG